MNVPMFLDTEEKLINLADSHCHLSFKDFDSDRDLVINNAFQNGIKLMIEVGTDIFYSQRAVDLAQKYSFIYAAVGIHPSDALTVKNFDLKKLEQFIKNKKVVAIGETGLDFYRIKDNQEKRIQEALFIKQIEIAQKNNLPLIIHCRDAFSRTIEILKEFKVKKAVFHCFTGNLKHLEKILENGWFVSFTGIVTFKNAFTLREVVLHIPPDKFFLETDCPFLAPQSKRGQRAEPKDVIEIAKKISEIKQINFSEVASKTFSNTLNFFNIKV